MPELADEMWALIEEGEEIRLAPEPDPATPALAWWAYAPALLACATLSAPPALLAGAGLAALERTIAFLRARAAAVTLHRAGIVLGPRGLFVAWSRAEVTRAPHGLRVGVTDGPGGSLAGSLPNFWAAAPVIELRTQLGPGAGARVHFRVRVAEGQLAVVGEVEPTA
jgi:hypothetical protein